MSFFAQLQRTAARNNSLLCVGLDPRPERFPASVLAKEDPILAFNQQIVDATRDLVCAYKPNYAFYEAHGLEGLRALARTIEYIGSDVPVILDAKRGDIGSTATAYARAAFEVWGAGAVTVHPYLGGDSIAPFLEYADRGVFVLCHTSNPGAEELQTLTCTSGNGDEPLYAHVARLSQRWGESLGLVVGATYPEALATVRALAPQSWLLVPGVGTQGGDLEAAVAAGLRPDGLGLVINASRGVCYAPDPRAAAADLRDQINVARAQMSRPAASARLQGARAGGGEKVPGALVELALDLARIGAVRFGSFTLHSGKISPLYIDLRLLASYPEVLGRAAQAYAALIDGHRGGDGPIPFDRIAAIPYAALPIGTAIALQMGKPLIYPRKEVKEYGTQRAIEGEFYAGERALVIDDLISTGGSKIEAVAPLEAAGLEVKDIVVLIDRESGGREALAERGYRLHAALGLRQMLDILESRGHISGAQRSEVLAWLSTQ